MSFEIDPKLYNELYGFIRKTVRNDSDASDILHDVLIKAQEKSETLHDPEKFIPWVYQIARNMITDYFRDAKVSVEADDSLSVSNNNRQVMVHAECELLPTVIAQLPDEYRNVYVLYEEGMSHKEIAQKLGISENLSKTRVLRAKQKIETLLKKRRCRKMIINAHDMSVTYSEAPISLEEAQAIDQIIKERNEKE